MAADGPDGYADRYAHLYTGAVFDVLRAQGIDQGAILPREIRPLNPGRPVVGVAFTVAGETRDGLEEHESLLRWTEFLTAAPSGHVVVCQPHDDTIAHMGELSAETLQAQGVRGFVVDGGCRDTEFIIGIGFPVWCRYSTPADIVGRWVPTEFGAPIEMGGVRIQSGDVMVGDRDGIVRVPGDRAEAVLAAANALAGTESEVRQAIRRGMSPKNAYLRFGAF